MNSKNIKITLLAISLALLFVQCKDDDDNGNVIDAVTCSDGLQNGDEEGVDCGGTACEPCLDGLDFSGTFVQQDIAGRPGINTLFSGTDLVKNYFNTVTVSNRTETDIIVNTSFNFQQVFEKTLEGYHDVYAVALELPIEDLNYETNILGLNIQDYTTFLAQFDALQVAPNGTTTYLNGNTIFTGRNLSDDVMDITLTLMFGGKTGTRFDGNNDTPQLVTDGVGPGNRDFSLPFPYLEGVINL